MSLDNGFNFEGVPREYLEEAKRAIEALPPGTIERPKEDIFVMYGERRGGIPLVTIQSEKLILGVTPPKDGISQGYRKGYYYFTLNRREYFIWDVPLSSMLEG